MNSKTTYDILKYGPMYPDRIRKIISEYFEHSRPGLYTDGWIEDTTTNGVDVQYLDTHFFRLWVYHNTLTEENLVCFAPRHSGLPDKYWLSPSSGIVCISIETIDENVVYNTFHEYFEELNQIFLRNEYEENERNEK